jgi:hypothetical protein
LIMYFPLRSSLCTSLLLALLSACGGGTVSVSSSSTTASTLSGLAATGAALRGALVSAHCVKGPALSGTTHTTTGAFELVLTADHQAPCILQVTGGAPSVTLHSFAEAAGTVNITPATDLIVAHALQADPASAFAAFTATHSDTIAGRITAATTYVQAQLKAITGSDYTADPRTGTLVVGDANDTVLDLLGAAVTKANKSFTDLRSGAAAGQTLKDTVLSSNTEGGGSGNTPATCNTALFSGGVRNPTTQELSSFAKTYSGDKGSFNMDASFTKSGSVSLALSTTGGLNVDSTAQTVTSLCYETAAAQLVVHFGAQGHVDLKADGSFSGVSADGTTALRTASTSGGDTGTTAGDWGSVTLTSAALAADRVIRPNLLPTFDQTVFSSGPGRKLSMFKSANPLQGDAGMDSITVNFLNTSGTVISVGALVLPDPSLPLSGKNYAATCSGCNGVTVDLSAGTVTFANTTLTATALSGSPANATLNGTYRLPNYAARSGTTVTAAGLTACAITADAVSATLSNIACMGGTYVGTGVEGQACTVQIDTSAQTFRFDDGVRNNTFTWTSSGGYTNLASYRVGSVTQTASMSRPGTPLETIAVTVTPIANSAGSVKVSMKALHAVGGNMTSLYDRPCTLELSAAN